MKNDNANSGPASGETSAAAMPIRSTTSPADEAKAVAKAKVGESAYLVRQQQLARQAMSRAVSDLLSLGKQAADPRRAMEAHPWVTLAASTAAGFAAAAVSVPSKEQQALRKLAKLERLLNPQPHAPAHNGNGAPGPAPDGEAAAENGERAYKSGRSSLTRAILGELVGALKPAIISLLTAGVTGAVAKTSPEDLQAAGTAQGPAQKQN
jgi:hypothetical protein